MMERKFVMMDLVTNFAKADGIIIIMIKKISILRAFL